MAHSPEVPEKYVCTACQVLHVGTVSAHTDAGYRYEAPEACGCCGGTEFVPEAEWPHVDR
ncbi:hypothetical protein [Natronococcus jeotgali]|uniref:Small CPxCG-related zinc finger protein n=1 Tax=Natronococcus jeotgali DSM 18795 TaxID=1227498 RepID=L9WPK3_9EURY|nr:hypothetical protein [Natronococcus jeotgali]ELY51131.1 hypothetical protein C492_21335 [Natronococcus jeotgali DSM 18795]